MPAEPLSIATVATTAKLTADIGQKLVAAFRWLHKDYRVLEAALRGNYEAYLHQSVSYYSRICSIIDPTTPIDLNRIYVPLTILSEARDKQIEVNAFPRELFNSGPKHALVDTAGMGKSTLAKVIFLKCVEEKAYLPIFVELRKLKEGETLLAFLAREVSLFRGVAFDADVTLHLLRSGLFHLILDRTY